jgi:hypothetical protein
MSTFRLRKKIKTEILERKENFLAILIATRLELNTCYIRDIKDENQQFFEKNTYLWEYIEAKFLKIFLIDYFQTIHELKQRKNFAVSARTLATRKYVLEQLQNYNDFLIVRAKKKTTI